MAATRVLGVVGRKGAGKTTLITALAAEYARKGRRVVHFKRPPAAVDPRPQILADAAGADLVLVEGWEDAPLPRIEVFRSETARSPIYAPSRPDAERWIALVTDDEELEAHCPVLRFRDTMWLQLLANMAWEKATPI